MTLQSLIGDGQKYNQITDAILYMIIKDGLPMSAIEKEGFKNLLKILCSWYDPPGRKAITEPMEKIFKGVFALMKVEVNQAAKIAVTADAWKYPDTLTVFLGVTGHLFLEGKMQTVLLALKELKEKHTGDELARNYVEVFNDWTIDMDKIDLMTTDGAANVLNSVEILVGKEKSMHCVAHRIHLAVTDALDILEIKEIITDVKGIVTYVRQSSPTSNLLKDLCDLRLIQDIITRWNYTLKMLRRFHRIKGEVALALSEAESSTEPPAMISSGTLEVIAELIKLL